MKNTFMAIMTIMVIVLGVCVYLGSVKNHDLEAQNQKLIEKQEVLTEENEKLNKEIDGNVFKDEDHYECTMRDKNGKSVTVKVENNGLFDNHTTFSKEVGGHEN